LKRFWKSKTDGKTLYLHVGLQKTGTTTIQTFLTQNRALLAAHGFNYPNPAEVRIGLDNHNHGHLGMSLTGYWRDTGYQLSRNEAWGELRDLYFDSDGHLVVSHEGLSTPQIVPHLRYVRKLLRGINVNVIIYLRRQDIFVQSVYRERLKANEIREFTQAFEQGDYPRLLDFHTILGHWQKCVGRGNVVVRVFEANQLVKGDVLDDFLRLIRADGIEGLERSGKHANPTVSRSLLEISRALNSLNIKGEKVASFKMWLSDILPESEATVADRHKLIRPAERLDILEKFAAGNEKIARDYLGRSDGRLFYDAPPNLDDEWQPFNGIPADDVARILAAMFDKYSILDL
jgi:hypothetical protein